jgi:hypothetical protein
MQRHEVCALVIDTLNDVNFSLASVVLASNNLTGKKPYLVGPVSANFLSKRYKSAFNDQDEMIDVTGTLKRHCTL